MFCYFAELDSKTNLIWWQEAGEVGGRENWDPTVNKLEIRSSSARGWCRDQLRCKPVEFVWLSSLSPNLAASDGGKWAIRQGAIFLCLCQNEQTIFISREIILMAARWYSVDDGRNVARGKVPSHFGYMLFLGRARSDYVDKLFSDHSYFESKASKYIQ